ncbi:hypothetical protein NLN82_20955 [Citrobacter portucalensis]|uniref:hypothetical protein n=1 Tax=Citrobacter portucalensis TaxID=1639133 RepID=UPI00226B0E93|nr:hypothetical protein [Citrobacter portucalensis]MCX9038500.1 hypothetical protein [Citrobacter portucalensis]
MANPQKPTITITISGPTGSGKSRIGALIMCALANSYRDLAFDAPQLRLEENLNGKNSQNCQHPPKGAVIRIEEHNEPSRKQVPTEQLCQAINMNSLSAEGILDIFKGYGFKDQHGHSLESCEHFHALVEMATKPAHVLPSSAASLGGNIQITADNIIGKRCPVHIQELMTKLGIPIQHYHETDLTPLLELVNWALSEKTGKTDAETAAISRGELANQLTEILEPHCKLFNEVKTVEAAVLALFTVMHPAHAARDYW